MRALPLLVLLVVGGACSLCFLVRFHPPMRLPAVKADEPADNSYCYVCHVNFKKEDIAEQHKAAGIGCADCHGYSDDHSSDEDGLTPPEIMFPAERIDQFCLKCHDPEQGADVAAQDEAVVGALNTRTSCTSCHGEHRVHVRTRRWDKVTGKLIYDDGVRMIGDSEGDFMDFD